MRQSYGGRRESWTAGSTSLIGRSRSPGAAKMEGRHFSRRVRLNTTPLLPVLDLRGMNSSYLCIPTQAHTDQNARLGMDEVERWKVLNLGRVQQSSAFSLWLVGVQSTVASHESNHVQDSSMLNFVQRAIE